MYLHDGNDGDINRLNITIEFTIENVNTRTELRSVHATTEREHVT